MFQPPTTGAQMKTGTAVRDGFRAVDLPKAESGIGVALEALFTTIGSRDPLYKVSDWFGRDSLFIQAHFETSLKTYSERYGEDQTEFRTFRRIDTARASIAKIVNDTVDEQVRDLRLGG